MMVEAMLDPATTESADRRSRRHESALIKRAQKRDPAAMRALIDQHRQRLFAFIWRMVRNHHDAEEICQDAFLKAFAAIDTFDENYRFSTWLFTIGYRLTLNVLRRRKPLSGEVDFTQMASDEDSVEHTAATSEEAQRLKELIWRAVDRLTPPQKAAVLLFYRQQQSCQQIGEVLEIPVATVKSHLHRARSRLKDLLEPQLAGAQTARILGELAG